MIHCGRKLFQKRQTRMTKSTPKRMRRGMVVELCGGEVFISQVLTNNWPFFSIAGLPRHQTGVPLIVVGEHPVNVMRRGGMGVCLRFDVDWQVTPGSRGRSPHQRVENVTRVGIGPSAGGASVPASRAPQTGETRNDRFTPALGSCSPR